MKEVRDRVGVTFVSHLLCVDDFEALADIDLAFCVGVWELRHVLEVVEHSVLLSCLSLLLLLDLQILLSFDFNFVDQLVEVVFVEISGFVEYRLLLLLVFSIVMVFFRGHCG